MPGDAETMRAPLALGTDDWRSRWLQTSGRAVSLHRVSEIEWQDGEKIRGKGVTVCGKRAHLHIPGIFSRMGAPRCRACCKALGIPPGDGAPYNVLKGDEANA